MLRIGEFSRLSGLSADALYHYEDLRILIPASVDLSTGYRAYDAAQLIAVNKIMALKDAGFSLEEIAGILQADMNSTLLIEKLEEKARSLEDSLSNEYERLGRLHTNIFLIKNGGIPQMNDITIKKVEPILVASIRFDEIMLEVEVAEPVTKVFQGSEDVQVYQLPQVAKMASIVHKGPFSSIPKTFDMLFDWMKKNQYAADGPIREIYHKGDWATGDPNEYITEIQIPVK